MAGLMGTNKLFSFNRYGTLGTHVDELTSDGIYAVTNGSAVGCPLETGILIHQSSDGGAGGAPKIQICSSYYQSQQTLIRFKWSTMEWFSWRRIDNFGYNTLEDLAEALKPLLGLS